MSIREQAKVEMARAGITGDDAAVMSNILELFLEQWDSGGAVSVMQPVLMRLIAGKPLSPLTGADDEWLDHGPGMAKQNLRCGSVFKEADGLIHDIDAPDPRAPITFPYDVDTRSAVVKPPIYEVADRRA